MASSRSPWRLALACALALHWAVAGGASLDEARRLAEQDALPQAIDEVRGVVADNPGQLDARLLLGVLLSRAGDAGAAIEAFTAIARDHPELPEPHNNLAVLYAAQGRYEDARDALIQAVRLQPGYEVAHENLGDVYAKLAALSYARASELNPSNVGAADKAAAAEGILGMRGASESPAPTRRAAGAAPATAQAAHCVRIAPLPQPGQARAIASWLADRGLQARVLTGAAQDVTARRYQVIVPPMPDAASARARIAELRRSGVRDLIIITAGEYRNGVSLGVYGARAGAERRVRDLAQLGIDAQVVDHPASAAPTPEPAGVEARGPFEPDAFARRFPGVRFEIDDCP